MHDAMIAIQDPYEAYGIPKNSRRDQRTFHPAKRSPVCTVASLARSCSTKMSVPEKLHFQEFIFGLVIILT